MSYTRRRLLATVGTVGGITLAGCIGEGDGSNSDITPEKDPKYSYPMMGTGDIPIVTYFGNWKCKYCRMFDLNMLPTIEQEYVESGKLKIRFRAMGYETNGKDPFLGPDGPRAARAGLIVWNIEPKSYWPYHKYVFENQPPESQKWATTDKLVEFASAAGVKQTDTLRSQLEEGKYDDAVKQTSEVARKANVGGTPNLLIGGELLNPLKDEQKTRNLLDKVSKK